MIHAVYNRTIRPHLPKTYNFYNGVAVPEARVLDLSAPRNRPSFKHGLIESIRRHVHNGDHVVEVGAGRGVATVTAARQGASVDAYEGSPGQAELARETVGENAPDADVSVYTRIVGDRDESVLFKPSTNKPDRDHEWVAEIDYDELPDGDVLLLDCEGAEVPIIEAVGHRYHRVIVEAHPAFDADDATVERALRDVGFVTVGRLDYNQSRPDKGVFTARGQRRAV